MHGTTIVAGGARAGKTGWLLERYRRVLGSGSPGAALWLSPTQRAAAHVREQLVDRPGVARLNPYCLTFHQFARRLLDSSRLRLRPVGLLGQRQIIKERIAEARRTGVLRYFGPIAETAGFLDLVLGLVQELKRLEIWPEELRDARGGRTNQKDLELFHLYDDYQRVLNEHDLYDLQGRFWSARAAMRQGHWGPFATVRHVFVDGFVDFTRTEHEMLQLLADRVESLAISLPLEIGSSRAVLFAKSAATLVELQKRHPELVVERMPRRDGAVPALAHVEQYLFANPRDVGPPPAPVGIEIVPTAGATAEIEWLARRIKSLLVEGDPKGQAPVLPADVLVVFRTLGRETTGLVRQVFAEYGVPVALDNRPPLGSAPLARALAAWLQLDAEDWPYRQLLALLVHDGFRPEGPEWREGRAAWAAESLVRRLQIPSGSAALLAQVERLADAASANSADTSPLSAREREALVAGPLLARVAQMLDALPERATRKVWIAALEQLARDSGLLRTLAAADTRERAEDQRTWDALIAGLEELARVSHWLGHQGELSRRDVAEQLQEVLRTQPMPVGADEAGRVRVLSAESARHVSAPILFVAGLTERSFPPAEHENCLYGEAETRELLAAGLPLTPRAQRRWHEMLLFYQVVTRAERQLVLSYPALDEAAQPLSPSPYLSEVERVFAARPIPRAAPPNLSVVPASDAVYSPRDFRVRAVARALQGDGAMLARLAAHPRTAPTARSIVSGLEAVVSREAKSFGPYEGLLQSEQARALLAQQFGADHCWSASQLEQYAQCPHQFFMERVLGVEPCEDPALAVDYAGRGQMLHRLLATLHRQLNETAGRPMSPSELAEDAFDKLLQQFVAAALARRSGDRPLADGLLEIDVRRMAADLVEYYRQHAAYDRRFADFDVPLRPAHFEVPFGPQRRGAKDAGGEASEGAESLSDEQPFELAHAGQTIRFAGRIDRIDVGHVAGRMVFSIIDYKSGRSESAKVAAILDKRALQLPLYALAAQRLLGDSEAVPIHIGYWHVAGTGCKETLALSAYEEGRLSVSAAWQSLLAELPPRLLSLVRGVRQGQFPMASADPNCTSRCAYHTVCRVNQVRALGKDAAWQPPAEVTP
jgi:ATP-dependent helicase/DNAse subunit B